MRPHLYKSRSVSPLVRWSVMLSSKSMKNGILRILNDLDSAGQEGRDEKEVGTKRKEGRGGRRNKERKKSC